MHCRGHLCHASTSNNQLTCGLQVQLLAIGLHKKLHTHLSHTYTFVQKIPCYFISVFNPRDSQELDEVNIPISFPLKEKSSWGSILANAMQFSDIGPIFAKIFSRELLDHVGTFLLQAKWSDHILDFVHLHCYSCFGRRT